MIIHLLDYAPIDASNDDSIKTLKNIYFNEIKKIYNQYDFKNYQSTHDSLDLHNDSLKKWLTARQLALIEFVTNS